MFPMKKSFALVFLFLLPLFFFPDKPQVHPYYPKAVSEPTKNEEGKQETATPLPKNVIDSEAPSSPPIVATEEKDPFPNLYGCDTTMAFTSGPLEGQDSQFTILGLDYFLEKGDKFYPGKETAVYYNPPHYLILHSAFNNGNILHPLEAEFLRYYLEYWGESGTAYIQEQIDSLSGSRVEWTCNGEPILTTQVRDVIRLSQAASDQLWLAPETLEQILAEREGLVNEWVGEMELTDEPTFYLGFCGWGPQSSGDARFYYYRYLINFDILPET